MNTVNSYSFPQDKGRTVETTIVREYDDEGRCTKEVRTEKTLPARDGGYTFPSPQWTPPTVFPAYPQPNGVPFWGNGNETYPQPPTIWC